MIADYEILEFESQQHWNKWLEFNHKKVIGVWLKIFKKGSNIKSVSYEDAVDEALCYGWIDGQRKRHDEDSFLQKFTPRRKKEESCMRGKLRSKGQKTMGDGKLRTILNRRWSCLRISWRQSNRTRKRINFTVH